ncbi:MAG: LacI family DNA-binding transcriptional regulator [Bacteroidota bacterium]
MNRKPSIKDVAKKAGLSLSTVSLVINNKSRVSKETRDKVKKIVSELNYHPQRSGRFLASKLSGNIGFILTEEHFSKSEPFYTRIFLGTEFEARKSNYYVLLTTVNFNVKETEEIPRFLLESNVDGVIIAGKIGSSWIDYIRERNLPLLLVDFEKLDKGVSSVLIDNFEGAKLAVTHLAKGGHKKIGFIGGDIEHPSIRERYAGFRHTVNSLNLSLSDNYICITEPETQIVNGYRAAKKIFQNKSNVPSAIFAANDAMAVGCIRFLKESGIRIPEDVAIIGFDNVEMGFLSEPRLTTINVHREEIGSIAVKRMVEMIKEKTDVKTKTITNVELVVRESCGIKLNNPEKD